MRKFALKVLTARRLGLRNIVAVLLYRFALKTGLHPSQRLKAEIPSGDFFSPAPISNKSGDDWIEFLYFGTHRIRLHASNMNWHKNHLTGIELPSARLPWWQIPDFDFGAGDIKVIWEPSRMNWIIPLAQAIHKNVPNTRDDFSFGFDGNPVAALNTFLSSWVNNNPCYLGPNWKCGQEASIRVMNLLLGLEIAGQFQGQNSLVSHFIVAHLKRISKTLSYALAQNNNHGTSEAAALYIGGLYLSAQNTTNKKDAAKWMRSGWKTLEKLAVKLILTDGTFSQYSTNYQRMMVDTYSLCDFFRRSYDDRMWARPTIDRILKSIAWLDCMCDPTTGFAANLGANDGSQILQVSSRDFRDFRPSLALAQKLFAERDDGTARENALAFFRGENLIHEPTSKREKVESKSFDSGGFYFFRLGDVWSLLRTPRFHFRPSHCDALHLDVWSKGRCILGDAGTYSYSEREELLDYFSGARGHNTVEFDRRTQMPRLGRFLFGAWLNGRQWATGGKDKGFEACAEYRDWMGSTHRRTVKLTDKALTVEDYVDGQFNSAVLRWRLSEDNFHLTNGCLVFPDYTLKVQSNAPIARLELVSGWTSEYYLSKRKIRCLEVELKCTGTIQTTLEIR
jgi:hypothetical protein